MRAINKLTIKDSNYSDYIQTNGTSVISIVATREAAETFEQVSVPNKRLNISYNSSVYQENSANGSYLETITLSTLPGGYSNFNEFKNEISCVSK